MRRRLLILAGGLQMATGLVILASPYLLEKVEYVHIHHPYAYLVFLGLGGWVVLLGAVSLYLSLSAAKGKGDRNSGISVFPGSEAAND